jgi:hypothetical protein
LADVLLREVFLEPQAQEIPLLGAQIAHEVLDGGAVVDVGEPGVQTADAVLEMVFSLVGRRRRRERRRRAGAERLARFEDALEREARAACDLFDRRRVTEIVQQLCDRTLDQHRLLLQIARWPDGPARVAKVTAHLSGDGRPCIAREWHAAGWVIAINRLEEANAGHLQEVIERLLRLQVLAGDVPCQREVALDELLAQQRVTRRRITGELVLVASHASSMA